VDEFAGALPEGEIRRFLEKALPSPSAGQLAEAKRLLSEGDNMKVAELLEPIVGSEPGHAEARVLLAQALLHSAPERIPVLLEPIKSDSEFGDRAEALRSLGRLAQMAHQPNAFPEDKVRQRYLAGANAVQTGDFEAALSAFIEVLERNRNYDDEGAKRACKAIFQVLGMRNLLTDRFFRAFSSALHA